MSDLEEKIATMQKQVRILRKNENKHLEQSYKRETTGASSLEEVILAIQQEKYLVIDNERITFKEQTYFNGTITLPIMEGFFERIVDEDNLVLERNLSGTSVLVKNSTSSQPYTELKEMREQMNDFYREQEIYTEFLKEEETIVNEKVCYQLETRTPSSTGTIHQYLVSFVKQQQLITVVFTCVGNQWRKWERIIEAMVEIIILGQGGEDAF